MNRKQFLKNLGLLFSAAIVAPEVLASEPKKNKPILFRHTTNGDCFITEWNNEFTITVQNTSPTKTHCNVSVTGFEIHEPRRQEIIYKVNGNNVTQNSVKRIFAQPYIYENFTVKTNTNTSPQFYLHAWENYHSPSQMIKPVYNGINYDFVLDSCSSLIIEEMPPGAIVHFTFKVKAKRQPMLVSVYGRKGVGKTYGPPDFNKFSNL